MDKHYLSLYVIVQNVVIKLILRLKLCEMIHLHCCFIRSGNWTSNMLTGQPVATCGIAAENHMWPRDHHRHGTQYNKIQRLSEHLRPENLTLWQIARAFLSHNSRTKQGQDPMQFFIWCDWLVCLDVSWWWERHDGKWHDYAWSSLRWVQSKQVFMLILPHAPGEQLS